jgi:hypothetical protein
MNEKNQYSKTWSSPARTALLLFLILSLGVPATLAEDTKSIETLREMGKAFAAIAVRRPVFRPLQRRFLQLFFPQAASPAAPAAAAASPKT